MSRKRPSYCPSCGGVIFSKDKPCNHCGAIIYNNDLCRDNSLDDPVALIRAIFRMASVRKKSKTDSSTSGVDTFTMNGKYYSKSKYKQNLAKDLYLHSNIDQLDLLLIDKKAERTNDPYNISLQIEIEAILIALKLKALATKKNNLC